MEKRVLKSLVEAQLELLNGIEQPATSSALTALRDGEKLQSLENLLELGANEVRAQIIEWFDRTKPTDQQLQIMFSKVKPRSVRQKISDWKRDLARN